MNLLEEMICDINYILENTFDEIVDLLIVSKDDNIQYNKKDIELFWLYMTFGFEKQNTIKLTKDFKETTILNLFHEHKNNFDYLNCNNKNLIIKLNTQENYLSALPKLRLNKYYYNLKEKLIYIRDILLPLYILTNKY